MGAGFDGEGGYLISDTLATSNITSLTGINLYGNPTWFVSEEQINVWCTAFVKQTRLNHLFLNDRKVPAVSVRDLEQHALKDATSNTSGESVKSEWIGNPHYFILSSL